MKIIIENENSDNEEKIVRWIWGPLLNCSFKKLKIDINTIR